MIEKIFFQDLISVLEDECHLQMYIIIPSKINTIFPSKIAEQDYVGT